MIQTYSPLKESLGMDVFLLYEFNVIKSIIYN